MAQSIFDRRCHAERSNRETNVSPFEGLRIVVIFTGGCASLTPG